MQAIRTYIKWIRIQTTCSTAFNSFASECAGVENQNIQFLLHVFIGLPLRNWWRPQQRLTFIPHQWWWWFLRVRSNINTRSTCWTQWMLCAHRDDFQLDAICFIPFDGWFICSSTHNREFQPIVRLCDANQMKIHSLFWSATTKRERDEKAQRHTLRYKKQHHQQ